MKVLFNQNYYKICQYLTPKFGAKHNQTSFKPLVRSCNYMTTTSEISNQKIRTYSGLITSTQFYFSESNKPDLERKLSKM
jgi:hypothetical protein